MIIYERDCIPRSSVDESVVEDIAQVVHGTLFTRVVQVVVQRNVKESDLLRNQKSNFGTFTRLWKCLNTYATFESLDVGHDPRKSRSDKE